MSAADEWDLTVPDDATELAAELVAEVQRRGIVAGQRLHIVAEPTRAHEAAKRGIEERRRQGIPLDASVALDAPSGRRGEPPHKRKSVRGILAGRIAEDFLTAEDFQAMHEANVEAAERRFGPLDR
jgi:hypothetical protein